MLKSVMISEIKSHFPDAAIEFGTDGNVIATFAPIHPSWEPIDVIDDGDEATVFFGNFTHGHYGRFGDEATHELDAQSIAADVIKDLQLVFDDQFEFYKLRGGGGGRRARGSQGKLSKFLHGANGTVWSGRVSQ
ncbi:MAG: hypothetical protein ACI82I_001412 [Gammaproteobacteria bacterium]|jgi:hypothetical protein